MKGKTNKETTETTRKQAPKQNKSIYNKKESERQVDRLTTNKQASKQAQGIELVGMKYDLLLKLLCDKENIFSERPHMDVYNSVLSWTNESHFTPRSVSGGRINHSESN